MRRVQVSYRAVRKQTALTSFFAAKSASESSGSGSSGGSSSSVDLLPKGVEKIDFQKNSTGFHTVRPVFFLVVSLVLFSIPLFPL